MNVIGYTYFGRPYVIGEAPGPADNAPMIGIMRFIAKLIGEDFEPRLTELRWINLLDRWPGYGPNGGSDFPKDVARERALELAQTLDGPRIYLGRRVSEAFGWKGEWFEWRDDQTASPHPSGLNRWWNQPEHRAEARTFWRRTLADAMLRNIGWPGVLR